VQTIGLGFEPTGLAAGKGAVWVAGGFEHALWRIDTADNVVRVKLAVRERVGPVSEGYDRGRSAVAVGEGAVWLAHGEEVSRIDPETNATVATIRAGGSWSGALTAGEGAVWIVENDRKTGPRSEVGPGISKIDPRSNTVVQTIRTPSGPSSVIAGQGVVLAAIQLEDRVLWIEPATDPAFVASTLPAGDDPVSLAFGEGAIWVANEDVGSVSRIDPYSKEIVGTLPVGRRVGGVAAGEGFVWVTVP